MFPNTPNDQLGGNDPLNPRDPNDQRDNADLNDPRTLRGTARDPRTTPTTDAKRRDAALTLNSNIDGTTPRYDAAGNAESPVGTDLLQPLTELSLHLEQLATGTMTGAEQRRLGSRLLALRDRGFRDAPRANTYRSEIVVPHDPNREPIMNQYPLSATEQMAHDRLAVERTTSDRTRRANLVADAPNGELPRDATGLLTADERRALGDPPVVGFTHPSTQDVTVLPGAPFVPDTPGAGTQGAPFGRDFTETESAADPALRGRAPVNETAVERTARMKREARDFPGIVE